MAYDPETLLAVGLTGPFGSGCTTLAQVMAEEEQLRFGEISLSQPIKDRHRQMHGMDRATRKIYQDIGNELRAANGADFLAKKALEHFDSLSKNANVTRVVFNSIRNYDEVLTLRRYFRKFFLIALACQKEERWNRVKAEQYDNFTLTRGAFEIDDRRDEEEDDPHGQQVKLCVEDSDILLRNDRSLDRYKRRDYLNTLAKYYIPLLEGTEPWGPSDAEVFMAMAFAQSQKSLCLKRCVGAAIATEDGELISTGYNENPEPMRPCVIQFDPRVDANTNIHTRCYKDFHMKRELDNQDTCPACHAPIAPIGAGYICPECQKDIVRMRFPDKGMQHCTAIHAEVRAIRNARDRNLKGCTLYTTTFTCFNCAKEVIHAKIRDIVFIDPYETAHTIEYLARAGVKVTPFDGVTARGFHRIFEPKRRKYEAKYAPKLPDLVSLAHRN